MDCEKEDKMEDIRNIANISGFGGAYEDQCQKMLQAGYSWLCEQNPEIGLKGYVCKNAYGILVPGSPKAEELSKAIVHAVDGDCSGAMHQAVMQHLLYIHKNGVERWKQEVKKDDRK